MDNEILTFDNIEIEKNKFYDNKTPIFLKDVDTEKVLVSNKTSFGEKNCKYFLIEDKDLIKKQNTIQDKVSADIKKDPDNKPVYNKKYLKAKIKSHGNEVTHFCDKEIPKETLIVLAQK